MAILVLRQAKGSPLSYAEVDGNFTALNDELATATSANTPSTPVKRDASGNFSAGTITAALSGNASTATTVTTNANLTGDVTSIGNDTAIAPEVITNGDISATAEIAVSKLANGVARQLLQTGAAGTDVEWTSNIDLPGTLDVTGATVLDSTLTAKGNVTLDSQSYLRFADADSSNWLAFRAPATVASNVNWTLPSTDGTPAQALQTDGDGTLYWGTIGGAGGVGNVFQASSNAFTGANTFSNSTGQTFFDTNATRDGIVVRGSTSGVNSNRVTLAPAPLTGFRTLTLPDVTGTVVTTGDSGTVTSTMIANGTIVNDDISNSANIGDTKLATISTSGKVSNTATTATSVSTASAIVARDASGNFAAGTITANLAGNASTVTTNASLTGDVTSVGNVTSIAAGVIVNNDISAGAAIVDTKLATISTAGKVSGAAITSGNISTTGSFTTTSAVNAASLIPTGSAVPANGVYLPATNTVAVATASTERIRFNAAGDMGVGTSTPLERVHIGGAGEKLLITPIAYAGNQDSAYLIAGTSAYTGATTDWGTYGMQHRFKANASGTPRVTIDSGAAELFCVQYDGAVGLGTNDPSCRLEVGVSSSNLAITGINGFTGILVTAGDPNVAAGASITIAGGTSSPCGLYFGDTADGDVGGIIYNHGTETMTLRVGGASKVEFRNTDNLLVLGGVTTATQIDYSICTSGRIQSDGTYLNTTANAADVLINSTGVFARSVSSIKYKTDVENAELSYSEALVYGSRPVWYRSLSENDPSDYSYWGFIAEEVAEIDPRMIHWNDDSPEGVQYARYVVHLVNVVQKQRQQLDALEARITALEG